MENRFIQLRESLANTDTKSKRNREELLTLAKSINFKDLRLMISPVKKVTLDGVIDDTLHILKRIESGQREPLKFTTKGK